LLDAQLVAIIKLAVSPLQESVNELRQVIASLQDELAKAHHTIEHSNIHVKKLEQVIERNGSASAADTVTGRLVPEFSHSKNVNRRGLQSREDDDEVDEDYGNEECGNEEEEDYDDEHKDGDGEDSRSIFSGVGNAYNRIGRRDRNKGIKEIPNYLDACGPCAIFPRKRRALENMTHRQMDRFVEWYSISRTMPGKNRNRRSRQGALRKWIEKQYNKEVVHTV
jgi:hypothetical protein